MGFFGLFHKKKSDLTNKKGKENNSAKHTNNSLHQLDEIFNKAEEFARTLDNNPSALSLDENLIQDCVNGIWNTLYHSALSTFVHSFEYNFQNGNITQVDYDQIKPLLHKWGQIDKLNSVDQQHYLDFKKDLRLFSKKYPKWFSDSRTMEEEFQNNIWKPWFEKYSFLAEDISKRHEMFLRKKRHKFYILVKTNYALISPYEFEELVADLFKKMGYNEVVTTPKSGDYGIDIIARDQKDVIAIQVKKYAQGNNVGNRDVQRLLGAMQLSTIKANKGILVTTSDFTAQAKEQAKGTSVELWNGEYFNSTLLKYIGAKHKE